MKPCRKDWKKDVYEHIDGERRIAENAKLAWLLGCELDGEDISEIRKSGERYISSKYTNGVRR